MANLWQDRAQKIEFTVLNVWKTGWGGILGVGVGEVKSVDILDEETAS